jgi:hypothetical protein
MTQRVLYICQIEPSLRCATLSTCEPGPAIFAARSASSGGGAKACTCARHLCPPSPSLSPARTERIYPIAHSRGESGIYRETASQFDPTGAQNRTTARWRDQLLGSRGVAAGLARRFRPWVTRRSRRSSAFGSKRWEIVWCWKKSLTRTVCSCPRPSSLRLKT